MISTSHRVDSMFRFGSRGEAYVVGQLAIVALVFLGPSGRDRLPAWPGVVAQVSSVLGPALIAVGIGMAVAGIVALGANLTALPRPKPGATLVRRGPYRIVRHPMYAGAILASLGWALAVHGWFTLAYVALIVGFFDLKARREERWLVDTVPGYAAYQRSVCRLIPLVY